MKLHAVGTWLSAVMVAVIGAALLLSFAMNAASEAAHQQIAILASPSGDQTREAWGPPLLALMMPNVSPTDVADLSTRAEWFDRHADRIRELAAAASLAGLVVMLATGRPERQLARSETTPAANTRSNGIV